MPTVQQVIADQAARNIADTSKVRGLSLQIIAEMNLLIPNVLVSAEDLNVDVSPSVNLFLQPAAKEALRRAIRARGGAVLSINSAYRTVAQQHMLRTFYEMGRSGISLAAKPGLSNHEDGLALDISVATPDNPDQDANFVAWRAALEAEGWDWLGLHDPFHFTYMGAGVRDDIGDIGVTAFQKLWNKQNPSDQITADSLFGPQTAARMNRSPAEGFKTTRLLKLVTPNLQGEDVRKVQQALVNAGFLSNNQVSGNYDAATEVAVKNFQDQKGLGKDGIVGPQTRKALGIAV
ncbi:peptidoglycan-binding protein [Trichocoleus sp. FACHB-591]|uniref:peptidoglycan-binding protein n=1 Tax=Trichocoleus sp. FACHB-591 TaxID=2692872 RepID=UPI0018EF69DC|nr:peptidoglycan-binding protein [Trichocoleus sp. FACHB-591]